MPSTCETAHLGDTPPFLVFKSILDISVDVVAFWVLGIFRGQFTLFVTSEVRDCNGWTW